MSISLQYTSTPPSLASPHISKHIVTCICAWSTPCIACRCIISFTVLPCFEMFPSTANDRSVQILFTRPNSVCTWPQVSSMYTPEGQTHNQERLRMHKRDGLKKQSKAACLVVETFLQIPPIILPGHYPRCQQHTPHST